MAPGRCRWEPSFVRAVWPRASSLGCFLVFVGPGHQNKIPETERLKQQTFISHSSGGWKSKIKVPADLGPGESSLTGRHLPPRHVLPWRTGSTLSRVLIPSWAPSSRPHLSLTRPRGLVPRYPRGGLGPEHLDLGGHSSVHKETDGRGWIFRR